MMITTPTIVTIIEDDQAIADIIQRIVATIWVPAPVFLHDATLEAFRDNTLTHIMPDLIFLDLHLPDSDEYHTLSTVQTLVGSPDDPETPPIIVMSGHLTHVQRFEALFQGAADFLRKPEDFFHIDIARFMIQKVWALHLGRQSRMTALPAV